MHGRSQHACRHLQLVLCRDSSAWAPCKPAAAGSHCSLRPCTTNRQACISSRQTNLHYITMSAALLLRAGGLCRPALASLTALRPQRVATALFMPRITRRSYAGGLGGSSVMVRAVAAERQAAPPPTSFGPLGVSAELQEALAEQGISEPTEIQAAAVPALLRDRGSDFLLASHTGSGKTLAYLLPIGALLCRASRVLVGAQRGGGEAMPDRI